MKAPKTAPTAQSKDLDAAWDERELGLDEASVRRSSAERENEVEAGTGLQMISVRLQKDLIERLKVIAEYRGIGYQPLMRDMLARFARSELLLIGKEISEQEEEKKLIEKTMSRKRA
jgi:predicted DNA binding CopG/RHH family protein